MAILNICLTCFAIFMVDANQEDLGQVISGYYGFSLIFIMFYSKGRNNLANVMTHTHYTRFGTITGR